MQIIQPQYPQKSVGSVPLERCCYTVDELMAILGVGRKAVYSLIHKRVFPAIRMNGVGYRIPKDSFHTWMCQH